MDTCRAREVHRTGPRACGREVSGYHIATARGVRFATPICTLHHRIMQQYGFVWLFPNGELRAAGISYEPQNEAR